MKKVSLLMMLLLAGCASDAPPETVDPFKGTALPLTVAHVEVVNPFVGYDDQQTDLVNTLAQSVDTWAKNVFVAKGQKGNLYVTIDDVSFKTQSLEKATQGVKGFFTKDQESKMRASVTLRVEFREEGGEIVRTGVVNAARELSLPEGLTLNERQTKVDTFIKSLVADLDERTRSALTENLGDIVVKGL